MSIEQQEDVAGPGHEQLIATVANVIRRHFRVRDTVITRSTVAEDVDGWDSLGHAALIARIEQDFGVDLGRKAMALENVGALTDCIAEALQTTRIGPSTREIVYQSDTCSIVRTGAGTNSTSAIFFAGRIARFSLLPLLEFERMAQQMPELNLVRYYVTDYRNDFYVTAFPEISTYFSETVPADKILVGNSAGGHAAIRFAEQLVQVTRVFALVPQHTPRPWAGPAPPPAPPTFNPAAAYAVLFGGEADHEDARYFRTQIRSPDLQKVFEVAGVGHDLAQRLLKRKLLLPLVTAALTSKSWLRDVEQLLAE